MFCQDCQRKIVCLVYRLGQEDRRIQKMLSQMTQCEPKKLASSK
jgi:hypothetical protein